MHTLVTRGYISLINLEKQEEQMRGLNKRDPLKLIYCKTQFGPNAFLFLEYARSNAIKCIFLGYILINFKRSLKTNF